MSNPVDGKEASASPSSADSAPRRPGRGALGAAIIAAVLLGGAFMMSRSAGQGPLSPVAAPVSAAASAAPPPSAAQAPAASPSPAAPAASGLSPEDSNAVDMAFRKLERIEHVSTVDASKEALALLEPIHAKNPTDLRTAFLLARAADLSGEADRAEQLYTRTAELAAAAGSAEREYFADLYLGKLLAARGKNAAAATALRRATLIADKGKRGMTNGPIPECVGDRSYQAYIELGRVSVALGKTADAAEALAEATRRTPNNPDAQIALGAALWKAGKRAEAQHAFDEALKLAPERKNDIAEAKR